MCNIAGYAGNRQAAPILLEMLRRQEYYDGNMSTGVATIHEGRLYYRKLVGNVDSLIENSDVLDLPGTIGIAHTRPWCNPGELTMHPNVSTDETMALVTNGTTPLNHGYTTQWNAAVDMLYEKGYNFRQKYHALCKPPRLSRNGHNVSPAEARVLLIEMYMKEGMTPTAALARACEHMYSDNVSVTINEQFPDNIYALRTTRPLLTVTENSETYVATCRFGFDEDKQDKAYYLPLFHSCVITREGVTVSDDKMDIEPVAELTPDTLEEGYRRLTEFFPKSKEDAVFFDKLELAALNMQDIWESDHTFTQHARLVYDVLYRLDKEGRLHREVREQDKVCGTRKRYYMWID